MKSVTVLLVFVVFCFFKNAKGDFGEFLTKLPREIGDALSNTWSSMIEAIKRPIRIKRLGYGGRRKTTTRITSTTMSTTELTETAKPVRIMPMLTGHRVPLIPTPRWLTADEWKNIQMPRFVITRKKNEGSSKISSSEANEKFNMIPAVTGPSKLKEEENLRVLLFI